MKIKIEKSVTVITPTLGNDCLIKAVESVRNQTYKSVKHLVVFDGPVKIERMTELTKNRVQITQTPIQTGKGGFYGHRIYAAYPHLVDSDYIAFLDDDNWYEPTHIETLINAVETEKYDWAYSLRKVWKHMSDGGEFLDYDNCEAIGKYPIWFTIDLPQQRHLVDTSAFFFKREFLIKVCNHWHSGWGGDRRFYNIVVNQMNHTNFDTSGLYTLNYRLPPIDQAYGGDFEFFKKGNEKVYKHYGEKFPWTNYTRIKND